MAEPREPYLVSSLTEGPSKASQLLFTDPGYVPPTWEDVRALMRIGGWTGSEVANLTGVQSRTVRKWTSSPDAVNHSPIPYSAWRLLLLYAGAVSYKR